MSTTPRTEGVIFILGIMPRSGTNFLFDLLALHPDCGHVPEIWEDYLLANVGKLESFVSSVADNWRRGTGPDERQKRDLLRRLAGACTTFLAGQARQPGRPPPKLVITKTPSVVNLDRIRQFPNARAVVIVRDGRDLVESGIRSFGWELEGAARSFRNAARIVIRAERQKVPFLRVRYEDLLTDLEAQLRRVFDWLELDAGCYDFTSAAALPVRGSSDTARNGGDLHWDPVERSGTFRPVRRWASWTPEQVETFDRIAGRANAHFDYD